MRKNKTQSQKSKQRRRISDTSQEHRRFEVLIEDVHDDVKLVAEQYGSIRKDINQMKTTLNSHTEMIGSLMTDVAIIKEDAALIKGDLKQKVDWEDFAALVL